MQVKEGIIIQGEKNLQDLHLNSLYHIKANSIVHCFIIHSQYFQILKSSPPLPLITSSKHFSGTQFPHYNFSLND